MVKLCHYCGKEFEINKFQLSKKYCSTNCRENNERKQRTAKLIEHRPKKYCENCGKELPKLGFRKWCSQKCAKQGWHKKRLETASQYTLNWLKNHPHHARNLGRKHKLEHIKLLGGKCMECGNSDIRVLEGHHNFTREGAHDFTLKRLYNADWKLLCANCHRIIHWEERSEIPDGASSTVST